MHKALQGDSGDQKNLETPPLEDHRRHNPGREVTAAVPSPPPPSSAEPTPLLPAISKNRFPAVLAPLGPGITQQARTRSRCQFPATLDQSQELSLPRLKYHSYTDFRSLVNHLVAFAHSP